MNGRDRPGRMARLALAGILAILALPSCWEGEHGLPAGTQSVVLKVQPASPTLHPGQSLQFTLAATGQVVTSVGWSVTPPCGGTFTASGKFTASGILGQYTIRGRLNETSPWTGTTPLAIVAPPALSGGSPSLTEAKGGNQAAAGGALENYAIAGEPIQAQVSTDPSGAISVRHGFGPVTR